MMWAQPGVFCVCINQEWLDVDSEEEVVGPELQDVCLIQCVAMEGADVWLRFPGEICEFHISGFRPLTQEEADLIMFRALFTGADASPSLEEECVA